MYMATKLTLDKLKKENCNLGRIGSIQTEMKQQIDNEVGEFFDLLCVAQRKKPIAAFDYNKYNKESNKLKKSRYGRFLNKKLINDIIEFSNNNNIMGIQLNKKGGMYIKHIFYYKSQEKNMIKLAYILWSEDKNIKLLHDYSIGVLLGYNYDNINQFYIKNYNINYTKDEDKYLRKIIKEFKVPKNWYKEQIEQNKITKINIIENI